MQLKPLISLIIKEFYSVWRDKKSRTVIFLPPVIQLLIFSHCATLDIQNIKIGVLNFDKTEVSRELTREIKSSRYFKRVYELKNEQELKDYIDNEKIRTAIIINNDFTKKYKKKGPAPILIISDGRRTNSSQIISSYVQEIITNFSPMGIKQKASPFIVENYYNPNLSYHWFIISCLAGILPMTTVVLLAGLSLAREKENGTFDELMVIPLSIFEIIFAKVLIPLFFGIVDGAIIILISVLFFNLPMEGSFLLYLFSLSLFLLSVVGVGLFVSACSKTQQQAMLFVFTFMFPAIMLSGYTSPIENITPKLLADLTVLNPLRFFLVISKGVILKNVNFYYILPALAPLFLIAVFTLFGAGFIFKKKIS